MFSPFKKHICTLLLFLAACSLMAQEKPDTLNYTVFYYANGVKSSEGKLIDGKPEGWWKSYNAEGKLISEGNRKNFKLDSLWVFYNANGDKTLEIRYKEGKKNGQRVQYLDDEFIIDHWNMDTLVGVVKTYYLDSSLKKITPYEDGKPHGMEKEFDTTGLVRAVTQYYRGVMTRREFINRTDNFGLKQGNWKYFWDNGNLRLEGSYQNDKKNGFFKEYDINGNFLSVSKYQNDLLLEDAPETKILEKKTAYHSNGQPSITATYYKGVEEGIRREFDTAGNVIKGYIFSNGKLRYEGITDLNGLRQGLWKEYYETGELRSEGRYTNSRTVGKWKFYFPNKTIEIVGEYDKRGRKTGEWQWFYPNGSPLLIENYEDGELEGEFVEYDEEGKELSKGKYVGNEKEGAWIYRNGEMTEKGSYYDGMRQGTWKWWYGNGKLASEIEFEQDLPNGKFTTHWENGKTKLTGKYITGEKTGQWTRYDEEGNVVLTTLYKDGVEIMWNTYKISDKNDNQDSLE